MLSRRRPEAVIEPSGKKSAAATDKRSGVSGVISSRLGTEQGTTYSFDNWLDRND